MTERVAPLDIDDTLLMLNFATRLLATELDRDKLVARALDTFSDFGKCERVALLTLDPGGDVLCVEGVLAGGERSYPERCIPFDGSFESMARDKKPAVFPARAGSDYPLPEPGAEDAGDVCLCVPMVGANNKIVGMITLEHEHGFTHSSEELLQLIVLATFTALAYENTRLFRQAIEDDLTGLYLRRYFDIRLREEMSRLERAGGVLSLIFLDLDHFKEVNDTYGHHVGDSLLRAVSGVLMQGVRRGVDIVCRYGGEEFVILLPGTDLEGARRVAERIRTMVAGREFEHPGGVVRMTLSAGVAAAGSPALPTPQELLRRADMMLLKAKNAGRNRVLAWGDD